ncbi:hypothetical protein [Planctobacterium marinum]|uniref:Uncharacterized protein n=1 Tax=Planctobacterium marinum TaxID=1631968 RepID=A0AA48HCR9_9ALTE|nr:hypothetical protein MACH26_01490 [Planctobacterium marinum]
MLQLLKPEKKKWDEAAELINSNAVEPWTEIPWFKGAMQGPSRLHLKDVIYHVAGINVAKFPLYGICRQSNALEIGAFSFQQEAIERGVDGKVMAGLYEFSSVYLRVSEIRFLPFKDRPTQYLERLISNTYEGLLWTDNCSEDEVLIWSIHS